MAILVVIGHPLERSLNHALAESYVQAARAAGTEVDIIDLAKEHFELSPQQSLSELRARDPEALKAKGEVIVSMVEKVERAQHIVIFHPSWWGTYPAVFKGFIDRVFMSGVAFEYGEGNKWKRLWSGKTARIFTTMDSPTWFDRLWYRAPAAHSLKYPILWYVGIKTLGITKFPQVRSSSDAARTKWLTKVAGIAGKDSKRLKWVS